MRAVGLGECGPLLLLLLLCLGQGPEEESPDLPPPGLQVAESAGVNVMYMVDPSAPTGTCAVCIKGGERSLIANLGAANNYKARGPWRSFWPLSPPLLPLLPLLLLPFLLLPLVLFLLLPCCCWSLPIRPSRLPPSVF